MKSPKNILITGCSAGIGKATAISLAEMGHNIIALNRKGEKTNRVFGELEKIGAGEKYLYSADLSEQASLESAIDTITQRHTVIDTLINNAGVFKTKETFSADGTEITFAVNVRAPAILTKRIISHLEKSEDPIVIFLSSEIYKRAKINANDIFNTRKYNSGTSYARSKMFINMLSESLSENTERIRFYSIHPGVAATDVFRDYPKWFTILLNVFISKPEKCAAPVVLAAIGDLNEKSGTYFMENKPRPVKKIPDYDRIKDRLYGWYRSL